MTDTNTMKVIEHFIIHECWEQNMKDLCEILEIYPRDLRPILENLTKWGFLTITKTIAKTNFYKLNQNSKLINPIRVLVQELSIQGSLETAKEEMEKEKEE